MNSIKEILSGFPTVFYINLDKSIDRRIHLEKQFQKFGIRNYTRVSADKFSPKEVDSWKHTILIPENFIQEIFDFVTKTQLSLTLNLFSTIIEWYDSNSSEYCILVEDDLSLLPSKYWNFTWNFFIKNLPVDWECVQLHVISDNFISMGLSRWVPNNYSTSCVLINRNYAEKLKKKFYFNGKYKLFVPGNGEPIADSILYKIGVTYSFPLFITNSYFLSTIIDNNLNEIAFKSDLKTLLWWKNKSKNHSIENLFDLNYEKDNLIC